VATAPVRRAGVVGEGVGDTLAIGGVDGVNGTTVGPVVAGGPVNGWGSVAEPQPHTHSAATASTEARRPRLI
jgi:hypothetical protein